MQSTRGGTWNTTDWRRFTRLVLRCRGRERLVLGAAVLDDLTGELREDFRWRDLGKIGPHAPQGRCGSVTFSGGEESPFSLEWASRGERLWARLAPARSTWRRAVFLVHSPGDGRHQRQCGGALIGGHGVRVWGGDDTVRALGSNSEADWVGRPGETLCIALTPETTEEAGACEVNNYIDDALSEENDGGVHGGGVLAGLPEVISRVCQWNTVWHPRLDRPVVVATRDWCRLWNGVLVFGWDTLLNAVLAVVSDPDLSYSTLECALDAVDRHGFVPNWVFPNGAATADRSHPPVGALAALRVWRTWPDEERMVPLLDRLTAWHDWWPCNRDRGDGLLTWGSSATPAWNVPQIRQRPQHAAICACWESGLDNSPLYDGVAFDPDRGTLVDADVGLNALWAADAERLAILARELGRTSLANRLAAEHAQMAARIEERLYDSARGVYANRTAGGHFSRRLTPTSLWPLLTGRVAPDRAERICRVLLDDPRKLGGEWGLPSVTRDDPAFEENDYWRGRVWGPLNFIAYEALRRAGKWARARRLATISRRHFERGWNDEGGVFENYSATIGGGGDVANSDRLYTWGGLLGLTAVAELIDAEPDGALVFGSPDEQPAEVRGWPLAGCHWDLWSGPDGLRVARQGREVLRTDGPAKLRVRDGKVTLLAGNPGSVHWSG